MTHAASAGPDLVDRTAIHDLLVAFYREVVFDELLEPVFGEVAEVDWASHIPHLIDYWCRVLLGQPGYDGAIVRAHAHVHSIEPLRIEHFDRWYALWVASIDSRWSGPTAERAKRHALLIGGVLSTRLLGVRWDPGTFVAAVGRRTEATNRTIQVVGDSCTVTAPVAAPISNVPPSAKSDDTTRPSSARCTLARASAASPITS